MEQLEEQRILLKDIPSLRPTFKAKISALTFGLYKYKGT
jgi:hypothetical protein